MVLTVVPDDNPELEMGRTYVTPAITPLVLQGRRWHNPSAHALVGEFVLRLRFTNGIAPPSAAFHAGDFDTELRWTKLAWLNEDLLQIDASDTTYATAVSGSGKLGYELRGWGSGNYVASAQDCASTLGSTQGEGVIDLRGTPYVIAGVNKTPCSKTCSGDCATDASDASASVCFQWIALGWRGTVSVTCSDGNQRCVVRCGGNNGGCRPIGNVLQLAALPPATFTTKAYLETAVQEFNAKPTAATAMYGLIADWGVSGITDMEQLFFELKDFNADISNWDTSAVTTMRQMFRVRSMRALPSTSGRTHPLHAACT